MRPIEPEELSAFVDGELDAQRMREVEVAIANDPAVRRALETIADADSAWRLAAKSARFQPSVRLPTRSWLRSPALGGASVLVLLLIRVLPKLSDAMAAGLLMQLPVLIALMIWVIVLTRKAPDFDGWRSI